MTRKRNYNITFVTNCEECKALLVRKKYESQRTRGARRYCGISCAKKSAGTQLSPNDIYKRVTKKTNGCWEKQTGVGQNGYTRISYKNRSIMAHRVSYMAFKGPIPDGLVIDHLCRNRACLNPDHLEAVTQKENVMRSSAPSALNAKKTRCKNGHDFTPENTRMDRLKRRVCKQCVRLNNKRRAL